jgi:hypothetical protein
MKNLYKNLFSVLALTFSMSVFSQTTHSFTFDLSIQDLSVTVQPDDNIELINSIGPATYGILVSQDGVNYTLIQTGTMELGPVFDTLIESTDSDFYLRVVNQMGIPLLTIQVTIDNTSSISDNSNDINFNVYPNPFVDVVTFQGERIQSLKVFDIAGKMVFAATNVSQNTTVDFSNFEAGTYIVLINNEKRLKLVK